MKTFAIVTAAAAALALASLSSAATTVNLWHLGEADGAGATDGAALGIYTMPSAGTPYTGGYPNQGSALIARPWGTTPAKYSSDVPANAKTPSTLSVDLGTTDGSLDGSTDLPAAQLDNWGVEAWVKPVAITTSNTVVFSLGWGDDVIMLLARNGAGTAVVNSYFQGAADSGLSWEAPGLADNTWVHLAIVRDSGTARLYVNGTASPTSVTAAPASLNAAMYVGKGYGGGLFQGKVDEVRMFSFEPGQFVAADDLNVVVPEPTVLGLAGLCVLGLLRRRMPK